MKQLLTYDEYTAIHEKLSIHVGKIIDAELIPKSSGLKLTVKFGDSDDDVKTAFTNLGAKFKPEAFIGISCPFIMNLTPSVIKGVNSEVMIMVGEHEDGVIDLNDYVYGAKLM